MSGVPESVELLITAVEIAAVHLAHCKTRESELDFARQATKSEAITRIMGLEDPQKPGKTYSATAAADIVSSDAAFRLAETDRREATAQTIRAMGSYEAARIRAWFAVSAGEVFDTLEAQPIAARVGQEHKVEVAR